MSMNPRLKVLMYPVVLVIGVLYYYGITSSNFPNKPIGGVVLADFNARSTSSQMYRSADDDVSQESGRGSSTEVAQQGFKPDTRERPLGENITVALFTINPSWLFKYHFTQSSPVIYRCPDTPRKILVRSAYQNVTLTRGADVVIFARSMPHELWGQVQAEREPHQVWVYGSEESAYKSPQVRDGGRPVGFGNFHFNMSFGYHSMSDVMAPYGEYVPFGDASGAETYSPPAFMFSKLKRKTKLVAWVSSHCDMQQWDRLGFVQELSEFLPIDKFGKCGDFELPRNTSGYSALRSYKFYLALENSCCREYITEKFWRSLAAYEAVPIVIGADRKEYKRVAPPNSFIFAGDFESMSDLAKYLRKVGEDDFLYRQFHEWRRSGYAKLRNLARVIPFSGWGSCALLEFLEERAWEGSPLEMSFDPYGPEWLGSCKVCSERAWLRRFDLNSDAYHPTMRALSQRPEYYLKDKIEMHRRQIAEEYMDRHIRGEK